MTKLAGLLLAFLLCACGSAPVENQPAQTPTVFTQQFICDNLRAGATVEAVVEWEASEGVDLDDTYPSVEKAVHETCPEFQILLDDYTGE